MAQRDPLVGTTIDQRFKVQGIVGTGKSSTVYRAEDLSRQYTVALKFLNEKIDDKGKERFKHGIEKATTLTHPSIVRLFSFHTTADGRPYFVMDCVAGTNLAEILQQQGQLSEKQSINVFTQVCDALDYAHAKGVVHRNLKPTNVMLIPAPGDSFIVKIADFGVAKGIGEKETRQSLARKGEMLGNPMYMAPEQCNGAKMDGRSDIYAAGCLLFECLTGFPPFQGANSFDVMTKHLNDAVPDLAPLVPGLRAHEQLTAILARSLAKKPEERYQDAGDMSRDLNLIRETGTIEEWNAQAICMKPVELKPAKVQTVATPPFNPMELVKPLAIAGGTLVAFIGGLVGLAIADPDVPSLTKYKVAVQEVILPAKDPRLLKNLNYMTDFYKKQGKYAEAWAYKEKIIRATEVPLPDEESKQ